MTLTALASRVVGSRALALLALLIVAGEPATGQEGQTAIVGRVIPVTVGGTEAFSRHGIRITIEPLGPGDRWVTHTDQAGRFRFDHVNGGAWRMTADSPAVQAISDRLVRLPASGDYRVDIKLAEPGTLAVLSLFWSLLATMLTGAFGIAIYLYSQRRRRRQVVVRRQAELRRERREPVLAVTVALLLWAAAFLTFSGIGPDMQPLLLDVAGPLSAVMASLLAACVIAVIVEQQPKPKTALLIIALGLLVALAARSTARSPLEQQLGLGLGLLLWTAAAGHLLALAMRRMSYLVLGMLTIAVVDTYAVLFGTTGMLVASDAPAARTYVQLSLLPVPVFGSDFAGGAIGSGDLLFLAWFLSAAIRFNLGLRRNFWSQMAAFSTGLILAHVMVAAELIREGLPALPFLTIFFLLTNRGQLNIEPGDRRRVFGFVGGLVLVLVAVQAVRSRNAPVEIEEVTVHRVRQQAVTQPWDLAAIEAVPLAVTVVSSDLVDNEVVVDQVEFAGLPVGDQSITLRGWLARPETTAPLPQLLELHGGTSTADRDLAIWWARQGYLCLSYDWNKEVNDGLDSDLAAWADLDAYEVVPTPARSLLYHAGAAAWQAARLLREHPLAAPDCLAVSGDSWGGLLALCLAALDQRIKALVVQNVGAVEGDPGWVGQALDGLTEVARRNWLEAFGPFRYAGLVKQPTLLLATTNDRWFSLPGIDQLYGALAGPKRLVLSPNSDHYVDRTRWLAARDWLAYAVGGEQAPLGEPKIAATEAGGNLLLLLSGISLPRTERAWFHVSVGREGWPGRHWASVEAVRVDARWQAELAIASPAPAIAVYAEAVGRNLTRSCSRLQQFTPKDLDLRLEQAPWPSPVIASFDRDTDDWRSGEFLVCRTGLQPIWQPPGQLTTAWRDGIVGQQQVALLTNRTDVIRRLGSRAEALEFRLLQPGPAAAWQVRLFERFGQATEERFTATFTPPTAATWQQVHLRLSEFLPEEPEQTLSWREIDALQISTTAFADLPPALDDIRLTGSQTGPVRPVIPE